MKNFVKTFIFVFFISWLAACSSLTKERDDFNRRKIYLTEEDYLEDIGAEAAKERREAQPLVESDYIFNVVPETDKGVYFFDYRRQPKIPGQPSAADYKREKRLWEKPKRYSPEQYYGLQGESSESSSEESSYDY